MSEWVKLQAADGFELSAYVSRSAGEVLGGIVILQEIFGVNKSIQAVADHYASEGFVAIAPQLMDRIEPGLNLGYGEADMQKAFSLYPKLNPELSVKDVAAAFQHIAGEGKGTAVLGFCYGGLTTWLSATRGPANGFTPACAIGYYAGGIGKVASEEPSCPVLLHFGAADDHIGQDQIQAVRDAHGDDVLIYEYEGAGHAFANPDRPSYVAEAAKLAAGRSFNFLKRHIA